MQLIMNDRADLCLAAGFDGVHVGHEALAPEAVRKLVGHRIIGASTHNPEQLREADQRSRRTTSPSARFFPPRASREPRRWSAWMECAGRVTLPPSRWWPSPASRLRTARPGARRRSRFRGHHRRPARAIRDERRKSFCERSSNAGNLRRRAQSRQKCKRPPPGTAALPPGARRPGRPRPGGRAKHAYLFPAATQGRVHDLQTGNRQPVTGNSGSGIPLRPDFLR